MTGRLIIALAITAIVAAAPRGAVRSTLADDSDRTAFRSWFTFLADAQFERRTADVVDCASLVRHAFREALRAHTPEWYRRSGLPVAVAFPDVRSGPEPHADAWPLFRVARNPERFAEFADASTLVSLNARAISRNVHSAEPGDLLYFRHDGARFPDHLMVFVGASRIDPTRTDWLVYHTGPDAGSPGEVRKVSLADLMRHPSPRWRPVASNAEFVGVFRLEILDRAK